MDCIIEVSGQEQKRFDFLSKKFGNRAALQALLEANPNIEIEGFVSDVEIGNRVNALAFSVVNNLIQDAAGVTDSTPTALDLRPENLEPLPLDRAIRKSKNDLEIILDEALEDQSNEENKNKATRAYVALQNFESLIPKIKERIEVYGLKLSELNNDLESAYNDETNEDTVKQHIYNMTHFEKSRLDSMSPSVKLFLATLPQKRFGENNQIEDVIDDLGMPVPVDFHFLHSTLSKNLADIYNFDEMMRVVESLGEEIPNIADISDFIQNEEVEGKQIVINARGEKVNNFKSAFYTSFVNTYSNFMTVTTQETTDSEGTKGRKVVVIPTNKRKFHKVLTQRWANEGARILNTPESARKKAWDAKLKTIFYPYSNVSRNKVAQARKERLDKLNRANNKVVLEEVSHALEFLGISVSSQALSQMKKEMNGKEKGSFGKYVDETIGKMAESMWVDGANIFKDESGNIAKLARIEAKISKDLAVESFMNGEGNQVHPINLPTHLTELFNEFKTKSGRYLDFIQDSFFENFKILRDFGSKNTMEIAQFDTIYDNDRGQGTPFDQLDPTSSIVSRLALFMNYSYVGQGNKVKANTSHAWMMMPTPADRSGTTIFKLKTLEKQDYSFMGLFDQGSEFKEWVTGVLQGEFERIKKVRSQFDRISDKNKLIENFHYVGDELGNGGYFNYYPELNQFLVTDETGDLRDIDFDSSEVQSVIQQAVTEQIQADLNYLEDIGVIEPLVINAKGDKTYYEFSPSKHVKSVLPSSTISDGNIMSFIVHSIIANHELSAMFNGDLAHFKSEKKEDGTRSAILENANKRAGLSSTPGRKLRIGQGAAAPEFRVAFMKDEKLSSDLFSVFYNHLPSKHANKYTKTESTDGQGFVSLDRYADILSGQGLLIPTMAQTIAELKKDPKNVNWDSVTETLQPVKGFLHGQRFDSEFGTMVPRVLKYSLLPIFPASIVDNPTMQNIYSRMQKNNIDETVFNTAAKYGATNLNSIKDEGDLDFVTISNEDWRIPQVVPYKTKTMENFGSQTRKLIMGNIKPEADYGGYTGEQLRARYQAAISQKLANSFKEVLTSISTDGKMDIAKVARKVLNDLSKNVFKSNSDFINKALEVVTLENGEIDTRIPMSFPAIKHKVESSLNSMIRKAVTKQDLPGFNAVVYSSIGYNKEGIKVSKNLKMARPSKDGKSVLPAEIIASPQYFIQSLYKKLNKIEDKTSIEAQTIMNIVSSLKNGTFDINSIPESLRQTVIYRIPTQGKNSMLPGIIVGFSPEVLGSVVTLPAEVVTQSGMDYDIDKIYLELKHFEINEGKFEEFKGEVDSPQGLDNTIVEAHYAVLTSIEHFSELVTPNNTDTLETLMKTIVPAYKGEIEGRKWSSLATQDDFREKNQAGGVFIGIASIANTAHAVFQELGVSINDLKVDGTTINSLSLVENRNGGLISDDHIEIQTAAVDNASNPILGNLNINTITGSTYLFLVEAGLGLKYPTMLVNSPIIRELTRRTRMNEAIMGTEGAFQSALTELAKDRSIDTSSVNDMDFDVSLAALEGSLDQYKEGNNFTSYDNDILLAFLTFRKYGNDMHTVQAALQIDNIGARQTLAANIIQQDKMAQVVGTYTNSEFAKTQSVEDLNQIETIKLDREKYKNHSMEAYERFGLQGAVQIVGEVIEDATPVFRKVLKDFQTGIGGNLVESDVRMLMNDFYTYLFANQGATEAGSVTSPLANLEGRDIARLLMGNDSVGKRVLVAQRADLTEAKNDIKHTPNQFLQSLSVDTTHNSGYDVVAFNNTITKTLTSDQKTMLTNEFLDMFNSENEYIQELAQDLFLYNFYTEGFSRGINSFSEFVPAEIYEVMTGDQGQNLVDYFRNIRDSFDTASKFDTDTFLMRFLQNRGEGLKGMKDLRKMMPSQIKNFLASNPKVNYFMMKSGKGSVIGKRTGKSSFVGIANPIGVKNTHVEYQSGNFISELITSEDVLKKALYSDDIIETENSSCIF